MTSTLSQWFNNQLSSTTPMTWKRSRGQVGRVRTRPCPQTSGRPVAIPRPARRCPPAIHLRQVGVVLHSTRPSRYILALSNCYLLSLLISLTDVQPHVEELRARIKEVKDLVEAQDPVHEGQLRIVDEVKDLVDTMYQSVIIRTKSLRARVVNLQNGLDTLSQRTDEIDASISHKLEAMQKNVLQTVRDYAPEAPSIPPPRLSDDQLDVLSARIDRAVEKSASHHFDLLRASILSAVRA